jgi:hypothetical protein
MSWKIKTVRKAPTNGAMNEQMRQKDEVPVCANIVAVMADNFRVGCRNSINGCTVVRITLKQVS